MKRRTFLKGSLAGSAVAVAVGAGLLTPTTVMAAWPAKAFDAKSVPDALTSLVGGSSMTDSGDISIKAPDIAENGAVVPVSVTTKLGSLESIRGEMPHPDGSIAVKYVILVAIVSKFLVLRTSCSEKRKIKVC